MLDYMVIALVLFFGVMGAMAGFLLQSLRLVAAVVAAWVSVEYSPVISESVNLFSNVSSMKAYGWPVITFAVFYLLMTLVAKVIVSAFRKGNPTLSGADRVAGGIVGAAKGVVLSWFIIAVALSAQAQSGRNMVALDASKSAAVRFVSEHPVGKLIPGSHSGKLKEIRISIEEAAKKAAAAAAEAVDSAADKASDTATEAGKTAGDVRDEAVQGASDRIERIGDEAAGRAIRAVDAAKTAEH